MLPWNMYTVKKYDRMKLCLNSGMEPKYYGASAQYNRPSSSELIKRIAILGGVVVGIITLVFIATAVFSAINAGPSRELASLVAKQTVLQKIADENKDLLKGSEERKTNADAGILLLSGQKTLADLLSNVYGLAKIPPEISVAAADPTIKETLDTARTEGNFDGTFVRIFRDKLGEIISQTEAVLARTGNADIKTALQDNLDNLTSLDEELRALG